MPRTIAVRTGLGLALAYVVFFCWYTSFGGPLSQEEIAHYTEILHEADLPAERVGVWIRFMQTDTGDDFAMLNAIELREEPEPVPGVEPGESSAEVLMKYSRPFMGLAMRSAAHPVMLGFAAGPAMDRWGIEGADRWTQGALVRYRSRRDLMNQLVAVIQMEDSNIHAFKTAAMQKTIAYPLDPWYQLGDPRFILALLFVIAGLSVRTFSSSENS